MHVLPQTVTVMVPPEAGYLALLRTAVGALAANQNFTLDQVDDLRMAVEEAAVQLLRKTGGGPLQLDVTIAEDGLEVRLHADIEDVAVIDPESFSWMILAALADNVRSHTDEGRGMIVLTKRRIVPSLEREPT